MNPNKPTVERVIQLIISIENDLDKDPTLQTDLESKSLEELTEYYCYMNDELFDVYWDKYCAQCGYIRNPKRDHILNLAMIAYDEFHDERSFQNIGAYYFMIEKNFQLALKYWKEGMDVKAGACESNYYIAVESCYFSEDNVKKSYIDENDINNMVLYAIKVLENNDNDNEQTDQKRGKKANILGVYYNQNNDESKALEYFKIGYDLGNVDAKNNYGGIKFCSGYDNQAKENYEEMFSDYEEAIEAGDDNALRNLSIYSYEHKNTDENMQNPKIVYYIGYYYYMKGMMDDASEYFMKGIKLNSDKCKKEYSNVKFDLATMHKKNEEYDEMETNYKLSIAHGNTNAMNNLGIYYNEIDDIDKAKEYLKMAADLGHDDAYDNYNDVCGNLRWTKLENRGGIYTEVEHGYCN